MQLTVLNAAFFALVFHCLFMFANIRHFEDAVGKIFLLVMAVFAGLAILSGKSYANMRWLSKSIVLLVILVVYIAFKLFLDFDSINRIRAYTIGTSGGIFFGVLSGMLVSYLIAEIYYRMSQRCNITKIGLLLLLGYCLLVLIQSAYSLQFFLAELRDDIFLIADQEDYYQRAGNYLFVQFMVLSAIIVVIADFVERLSSWPKKLLLYSVFLIYIACAILQMATSQLVGSNSGFASIFGFAMLVLIYVFGLRNWRINTGECGIGLVNMMLFGFVGRRMMLWLGFGLAAILLGIFLLINYSVVDFSLLRITGYGGEHTSSFVSRQHILQNNFLLHLGFAPIFGNSRVEMYTTGEGTYVHSLLSLLTHQGVVGMLLFVLLLRQIHVELGGTTTVYGLYYENRAMALFRIVALSGVVLAGLLSSFYIWLPLWFAIGLFGVPVGTRYGHFAINTPANSKDDAS